MATIDHDFIDRKRAIIAQIERDATNLPNPFLDAPKPATRETALRKALTHSTRKATMARPTRKR